MLTRPHPPPDETPTLPHLCPHHSLRFHTPASSSPWLKILTLLQGPQVMPPTRPSPPLRLLAPTQHAYNAAYYPYAHSALPTCLQHSLPSLRLWSAFLTCLLCRLPSFHSGTRSIEYVGLLAYMMNAIRKIF
ncbi:hypothetical protein O181_032682 [Austropuccinia psidii MF-1]|uniref:Uncharacterized protein n=1 Tax=Austropuccinia psidii MF-1 TaxID=1389203 RepID=A0A9Q3CZX8_9BASI|nr:hypothetical protein [Austropuccinia psidii MF-1]